MRHNFGSTAIQLGGSRGLGDPGPTQSMVVGGGHQPSAGERRLSSPAAPRVGTPGAEPGVLEVSEWALGQTAGAERLSGATEGPLGEAGSSGRHLHFAATAVRGRRCGGRLRCGRWLWTGG